MSKPQTYTQCVLELKLDDNSKLIDQAWIPTNLAKVGKTLRIKNSNDEWVNGWVVVERGATKDADFVEARERDYTRQRQVSDI